MLKYKKILLKKSVLCIEFYVAPTELDDLLSCFVIKMLPLWGIDADRVLF
jgi:3-polyprenyl-4-hydroxybenzoate decarboxylase